METQTATRPASTRRLPLFLIGILLFLLGPAIYVIRFSSQIMETPWYAPILATVGVLFLIASVAQRPGVARMIGLVLLVAVCALEWFMVLVAFKAPPYTGPGVPGQMVPAFATTRADGTEFSNRDLAKGMSTVLLFFRGRW
jgi:hypothetical protein